MNSAVRSKTLLDGTHFLPMSAKANEWTVLLVTLLGKRRCASSATDLLKATYRKRRCGRCSAYLTSVVVLPVPAGRQPVRTTEQELL